MKIEDAEEGFADFNDHASKYNKPLFTKYNSELGKLKDSVGEAKKVIQAIDGSIEKLAELRGELDATKEGFKEEFAEVERDLVKALEDKGVTSIQPDAYIALTEKQTELQTEIAALGKRTSKQSERHQDLLESLARLNDAWHEEFKLILGALNKTNAAQGPLQIKAIFKGDKTAFLAKLNDTFRGSNIRKEAYQALADK